MKNESCINYKANNLENIVFMPNTQLFTKTANLVLPVDSFYLLG